MLEGVTFEVARGTVHAIIGPNGAGKSTLLSAILGQTAFGGRIAFHFVRRGDIGFVPQSVAIDRTLPVTVRELFALSRQRLPVCLGIRRTNDARCAKVLDRVGLAGFASRRLGALSGGELQRVLFANALDPDPEVMILDEPASGIDQTGTARVEALLAELRDRGTTTILVSHDIRQVRRLADSVTHLERRVVSSGTPADVLGDCTDVPLHGRCAVNALYEYLARLAEAGSLPSPFRYPFITRGLLAVLVIAPLLGGMSHVVVARRLAFLSSALGHAALTGLTLGLLAGAPMSSPYAGMLGFCLLAGIAMVYVKRRSSLPPDTLIGVFMSLTLGLRHLPARGGDEELQHPPNRRRDVREPTDGHRCRSPDSARGERDHWRRARGLLQRAPARQRRTSARGCPRHADHVRRLLVRRSSHDGDRRQPEDHLSAFLVEALVVVPAAAARNLAKNTRSYWAISIVVAVVSGFGGIFVSSFWKIPTGGAVVLALTALFFVTLGAGSLFGRRTA